MVLNLRSVVSNWPGVVKVTNKNDLRDKEYVLVGTDEQEGAMWLGNRTSPVEVRYVGRLPDGRFASFLIMSLWDENWNLCWKFAADATTYRQGVNRSRAFVLQLDVPATDSITLSVFTPEDSSFDSNGTTRAPSNDVSRKIAGTA